MCSFQFKSWSLRRKFPAGFCALPDNLHILYTWAVWSAGTGMSSCLWPKVTLGLGMWSDFRIGTGLDLTSGRAVAISQTTTGPFYCILPFPLLFFTFRLENRLLSTASSSLVSMLLASYPHSVTVIYAVKESTCLLACASLVLVFNIARVPPDFLAFLLILWF